MKTASPQLIAHLAANNELVFADLYTFALSAGAGVSGGAFNASGVVARYADFDTDITTGSTFQTGALAAPGMSTNVNVATCASLPTPVVGARWIYDLSGLSAYWEVTATTLGALVYRVGIAKSAYCLGNAVSLGGDTSGMSLGWGFAGGIYYNGAQLNTTLYPFAQGDVLGLAYSYSAGTLAFYRNGVLQYTATGIPADSWFPAVSFGTVGEVATANFGQANFSYAVPGGYAAPYSMVTFTHGDLVLTRDHVSLKLGLSVDTLKITAAPQSTSTLNGVPFLKAVALGMLDGARVRLDRVFLSSGQVVGGYTNFSGIVGEVSLSRSAAEITVNSDIFLLNLNMPRNLYMTACQHTLFDADCGLSKAAYARPGAVQGGSSGAQIVCSGQNNTAGWFDAGSITFTSGAFSGISRTVRTYANGAFQLLLPLPGAPAAGDTFNAYPGCAKSSGVCANKFNNAVHFRGYERIPLPETIL